MKKKKYEDPELEIIMFSVEDIMFGSEITGGGGEGGHEGGEEEWDDNW